MKKPLIFNRKIMDKLSKEQNGYLKSKLNVAKSGINNHCPESFSFYTDHNFRNRIGENPCN